MKRRIALPSGSLPVQLEWRLRAGRAGGRVGLIEGLSPRVLVATGFQDFVSLLDLWGVVVMCSAASFYSCGHVDIPQTLT